MISVHPVRLLEALRRCSSVIESNASSPPLKTVHIKISGKEMQLTGTNLVTTVVNTLSLEEDSGQSLSFCADYNSLYTWLSNSFDSSYSVEITMSGDKVRAKAAPKKYANLITMDAGLYPVIYSVGKELLAVTDGRSFSSIARNVADLAANESHHEMFANVMLGFSKGKHYELQACDGQLYGWQRELSQNVNFKGDLLVNHQALLVIQNSVTGSFDTVEILRDDKRIFFRAPHVYAYTGIQNAKFPDLKPFLATDHPNKVLVNRESVIRALSASLGFASEDEAYAVRMSFDPPDSITIGSIKTELGDNADTLSARVIGETESFLINLKYALKVLQRIEGVDAWIHFGRDDRGRPAHIHFTDVAGQQKFVVAGINRNV